jgi:hypothetical protein
MKALWSHGIEPPQPLDANTTPVFKKLEGTPDVLCCVLNLLSAPDLAAACGTCRHFKPIILELVVPARLERARADVGGSASAIISVASLDNPVQALHLAEEAQRKAAQALREKKALQRASLPNFLDHIRCEAAFRGLLTRYEERIDAIEAQQTAESSDETIDRLYDEATAMENEIHAPANMFGGMGGPGLILPGVPPGQLPIPQLGGGAPNPGGSTMGVQQMMQMIIAMANEQHPPQAHT